MKKIYFACSIRSGGDTSNYEAIVRTIKDTGAEVLSEVFVYDAIHLGGSPHPDKNIYKRDTEMIKSCDAIIAEVTNPSLGVGYELAYSEKYNKPVLCLFDGSSDRKISAMIAGDPNFKISRYTTANVKQCINKFLAAV